MRLFILIMTIFTISSAIAEQTTTDCQSINNTREVVLKDSTPRPVEVKSAVKI